MKLGFSKSIISFVTLIFMTACSSPHSFDKRVDEQNYRQVNVALGVNQSLSEPIRILKHDQESLFYSNESQKTPLHSDDDQMHILVLSGGGANGAFGAGILNGLYEIEQVPTYTVVTGISAGAMIAPFAFVGGDKIPEMKEVMLGIRDSEIVGKKNLLSTLFKDAFTKGDKLVEFIEKVYTPEFINDIAKGHEAGRRLLIGTTQFDSEELVVWNVGLIASSNMPNKIELIHKILAASASIPGVFPPQFIDVDGQGELLEELHVDGGLSAQMFLLADHIDYDKINRAMGLDLAPTVHVIRNGRLALPYKQVADKGIDLLTRSVKSMTVNQSVGDLYRMAYFSQLQGLNLEYSYIERHFDAERSTKDMFDSQYMLALYQYGYLKAKQGQAWSQLKH
ncbi:patatin-like phospholipase family protein [Vibrio sp. SCSIO 43135]|uniref:patatin-like phospholipase family protein n=1 Tax=Vibrio sp. SCSIO 43135 TaxID=2819096 RepID=UPI0020755696|nr:patatin-like phospholipase family protein [Vibrio sp. SCSIO 43135]USD44209.1 patatin-like phospholipase family protein [Vibrio sp. SCSIO 43135]